jgi:hypothetical protein
MGYASEPPDGECLISELIGIFIAQLVIPVLQLGPDEQLVGAVEQRIPDIPAELGLGEDPRVDLAAKFVITAVNVLGMALEAELLAADIDRIGPVDIDHEGIVLLRRTAAGNPLVGVDIGGEIGIEEGEARDVPLQTYARQELQHIGIRIEVDPAKQANVPQDAVAVVDADDLAGAEVEVGLAVGVLVIEVELFV